MGHLRGPIKLNDNMEPEFDFGQDKADAESAEPVDFSAQESLGNCPKCKASVYEHGNAYVCEKSVGPEKTCDFRSGKVILQQPIDIVQMKKLLADGKTDLLREFVSNRTRRKFSAYLVAQEAGRFRVRKKVAKPRPLRRRRRKPDSRPEVSRETQRVAVAPGNWQDKTAARTASIAWGRGKVTRQTRPTVRFG